MDDTSEVFRRSARQAQLATVIAVPVLGLGAYFAGWLVVPPILLPLALIWLDQVLYRVRLHPESLSRSGLFGTKTVELGPDTRYFYRGTGESLEREQGDRRTDLDVDDGRTRLKISVHLRGIEVLRRRLIEHELASFLPAVRASYKKGGAVDFGPIHLQRGVMKIGDRVQTLGAARDMRLYKGKFRIRPRGRDEALIEIPVERIPNLFSFFQLMREIYQSEKLPPSENSRF